MQARYSSNETSVRLTAKAARNATGCCGPSLLLRPLSSFGEPIRLLPAGATAITGHMSHSRKKVFPETASPRSGAVVRMLSSAVAGAGAGKLTGTAGTGAGGRATGGSAAFGSTAGEGLDGATAGGALAGAPGGGCVGVTAATSCAAGAAFAGGTCA